MRQILLAVLFAALTASCGKQNNEEPKLQENTEEYFKAHGIVPGQVNELSIGGTLFRFPAGVGLNPYTATGIPLLADGGKGMPLGNEPRRILKGQADSVSMFFGVNRNLTLIQIADPRGATSQGMVESKVEIVIGGGYQENSSSDWRSTDAMKSAVRSQRDLQRFGLEAFVYSGGKNPGSKKLFYLSTRAKTPRGGHLVMQCNAKPNGAGGYLDEPVDCSVIYQAQEGFSVTYIFSGAYLLPEKWQALQGAVSQFIDSVIVK